jgi:hypothetical protein
MLNIILRGGRNIENQNVEGSERRKYFLDDQNVENHFIEKNVESHKLSKMTFNVLIFFDAIGNIRTSKVL